jgi:hypothetical protein
MLRTDLSFSLQGLNCDMSRYEFHRRVIVGIATDPPRLEDPGDGRCVVSKYKETRMFLIFSGCLLEEKEDRHRHPKEL